MQNSKDLNTLQDYKAAYEHLLAEHKKLKAQYNHIPISTFTFEEQNGQLILVQYNNEACKLCEKEKDLHGLPLDEVFVELVEVNESVKKCFQNRESFSIKTEWNTIETAQQLFFSANFVFIPEKTVMLHLEDITERRLSKNELKNSEANLRAIFESNTQAYALFNTQGDIEIFNTKAEENIKSLFGKKLENESNIYQLFSESECEYFLNLYKKAINGIKASFEKEISTVTGEKQWFEINFNPSTLQNEVKGVFLNIIDISKHKFAEIKSRQASELENEFGKMKNNFISIVSHEFRTPLAGIKSNTQLIQKYANRWDKEKKSLVFKRIYNAIQYLNQMLDGVSLLGRDYSGKLSFNEQSFELEPFCLQIIDEAHISIGKAARINFSYISGFSTITTDKVLLRHIITNLLSNAVKYSPQNKTVDFDVVCTEDKQLKIKVKDYGIGISEKDMKHIFEPFQRGENVENIQGTGLGLAIVRRCIDLLNGTIKIESELYRGTTFYLEFKFK